MTTHHIERRLLGQIAAYSRWGDTRAERRARATLALIRADRMRAEAERLLAEAVDA